MGQPSEQAIESVAGPTDDYALMIGVRDRDAAALAALFDRYSGMVYGLCLRGLRDRRDAEDLLIDVFTELWTRGDRYDPCRGSPVGHLIGLARSRLVDRLRSRRAGARARTQGAAEVETASDVEGSAPGPLDSAINAEQQARVAQALAALPVDQRQALELAYFEALSHTEVAQRLGQPLGTVKSRIRQALIQLRQALGRQDQGA
jgi:RNA polymerase sigma-70 factor, ECF subfamily